MSAASIRGPGTSENPIIAQVIATSAMAGPQVAPSQSMIIGPLRVKITFCGCRSRCSSTSLSAGLIPKRGGRSSPSRADAGT